MRSSRTLALSAAVVISALSLAACSGTSTVFSAGATGGQPSTTTPVTQTATPPVTTTQTATPPVTTTQTATTPSSTATTTTATIPSSTATTTTQTATATTPTSTSPALVIRKVEPVGSPCWTDDLRPTYLGSNGLTGSVVLYFALTNTESVTCHTYGWPKVEFLSAGGAVLSAQIKYSTKTALAPTPRTMIDLKPGQQAFFRIVTSLIGSGGRTCPRATELELTVPYDTLSQDVAIPRGAPACGAVTVSPVLPRYIADAPS